MIKRLARLQYDLISNAATFLKVDGSLVYSTCSILPEENEEVIELFIKNNSNFVVEPASSFVSVGDTYLKVLPGTYYTDGVFAARLKRLK